MASCAPRTRTERGNFRPGELVLHHCPKKQYLQRELFHTDQLASEEGLVVTVTCYLIPFRVPCNTRERERAIRTSGSTDNRQREERHSAAIHSNRTLCLCSPGSAAGCGKPMQAAETRTRKPPLRLKFRGIRGDRAEHALRKTGYRRKEWRKRGGSIQ
jgi:hypothetical protein